MTIVRCPMIECRRRIDLDALPRPPEQPAERPCLHYIATWEDDGVPMAEAVLFGLTGNRELIIRNLRPGDVSPARINEVRGDLEIAARRFGHEADEVALFGDVHERNRIALEFAQLILGPDPMIPPGAR